MAIFVHNLGVFSKLYSEAVEAIDPRPVEGIRATGARRIPEIVFGVLAAGRAAVELVHSLSARDQCALGHHARYRRRRRHQPDAL